MTGFLSLQLKQGAGAEVKILTSECYVEKEKGESDHPMRLPKKGDRCDWENGELNGYTDTYHVAGYGDAEQEEIYEPFWFRTFRFVRLEIRQRKNRLSLQALIIWKPDIHWK